MRKQLLGLTVHAAPDRWVDPDVPVGSYRTHDWEGRARWDEIELEPGRYNFDDLDWLAAKCAREGKTLQHVVYGTPRFYASSDAPDPYHIIGRASMPTSIAAFQMFVAACTTRYPASLMPVLEVWNEGPLFFDPLRFALTPKETAEGWAQLARLTAAAYPYRNGAKIATPSVFDPADLDAYLQQPGAKKANAVALHLYGQTMDTLPATLAKYQAVMKARGVKLPFVLSELGWQPESQTPAEGWKWGTLSADDQGTEYERMLRFLDGNALAISAHWYSWDAPEGSGITPMRGHAGLRAAMARLAKGMRFAPIAFHVDQPLIIQRQT